MKVFNAPDRHSEMVPDLEKNSFADVLWNIERSMCRMMTPFNSEDTLYLKEVSGSISGGPNLSRKVFIVAEDNALLSLKRNF